MGNIFNLFASKNLKKYWINSNKKNFDDDLVSSMEKFFSTDDYKKTSTNHKYAIIRILKIIENYGNKESIRDFQFNNPNFHSDFSSQTISELVKEDYDKEHFEDLFKLYPSLKIENSLKLNLINNLIYNKLKDRKIFELITKLSDETFIGHNQIFNEINGLKITQEKLRTLLEYENIEKLIKNEKSEIIEIGSGNGRMCECIMSCNKYVNKYILADIPPALPSAYKRLKKTFKNKKIFYAIHIKDKNELKKIIQDNEIILIFPNQIKLINKKFDLFIAIDCLHEMKKNTIKEYINIASVISNKIYFKVHEYAHVPFSTDRLSVHNDIDYSIKPEWKLLFKKKSFFPSTDYEISYEIKK
tara:strand:- start:21 stop:1094 length:1074 start_codon:yes stop_codon:yes gene_type:complete